MARHEKRVTDYGTRVVDELSNPDYLAMLVQGLTLTDAQKQRLLVHQLPPKDLRSHEQIVLDSLASILVSCPQKQTAAVSVIRPPGGTGSFLLVAHSHTLGSDVLPHLADVLTRLTDIREARPDRTGHIHVK